MSVSDFYDSCNVKEEKNQIKNLENIMWLIRIDMEKQSQLLQAIELNCKYLIN